MAYYNQNQNQSTDSSLGMNKKKEEEQAAPESGAAPVQLTSASANGADSGNIAAPLNGNPIAQNNTPKSASSGMGGGFQSYQKANQGAATNRLAQASAQNVTNQGNAAKTSINQATNQFGKKVDAGTLANRHQAVQDVSNTVSAARGITAPAAATPAAPIQATATPAQPNAALAGIEQKNLDRFQEVINTKYQGPESLRQAGLYQLASKKVGTAQNTINQTKTATGREEMLRDLYAKRGDYTKGLNKLDSAVLNSSQAGVKSVQDAANSQGNIGNELAKAQTNSTNLAQNRTQEVNQIRNDARQAFTTGKKEEEQDTEDRLTAMTTAPVLGDDGKPVLKPDGTVLTQWEQLPQHFKNIIANKSTDNAKIKADMAEKAKSSPEYAQAQTEFQQAQAALNRTPATITAYNSNRGFDYQLPNPAYAQAQAAVNAAQNKINGITQQAENNVNMDAVNFNAAEAAILGINSGEGLYNLGADAIKVGNYDKQKLISKDEQARQAALSALAGLDKSNQLDTNLKYDRADLAGTQSALDALDLEGTRAQLNDAEKMFQEHAEQQTLTGYGMKKNKTSGKKYYADESANLGNILKNAGYQFGETNKAATGNSDILNSISKVSSGNVDDDAKGTEGSAEATAAPWKDLGHSGTGMAQTVGNLFGTVALNQITGALGLGSFGNAVGSLFGSGTSSKESKSDAARFARQDLENKVQNAIKDSGFQNRTNIVNTDTANNRLTALQQLLDKLDKNNR